MHQRSWVDSTINRTPRWIGRLSIRVVGSKFVMRRVLPACVLLVLCLRHAVASISV